MPTETFDSKETRTDDLDDALDTILSDLTDAVDEAEASDTLKNWLDTFAQFHDYSFNNILLAQYQLAARDTDADRVTRLAGYNTWQDMGRNVKKGESALWILAPSQFVTVCNECDEYADDCECDDPNTRRFPTSFRDVPVFDMSQTEGDELPDLGAWDISGDAGTLPDALIDVITADEFDVRLLNEGSWPHGSSKGVCKHDKDEIDVLRTPDAQLARTLIHEYAHAVTHADDHDTNERARREVEADAVAYVVGTYYGLDMTGSTLYVARWQSDDPGVLRKRLNRIGNVAKDIIEATDDALDAINTASEKSETGSDPIPA